MTGLVTDLFRTDLDTMIRAVRWTAKISRQAPNVYLPIRNATRLSALFTPNPWQHFTESASRAEDSRRTRLARPHVSMALLPTRPLSAAALQSSMAHLKTALALAMPSPLLIIEGDDDLSYQSPTVTVIVERLRDARLMSPLIAAISLDETATPFQPDKALAAKRNSAALCHIP